LAEARLANLEKGLAAAAPITSIAAVDPKAIELAFWETIKDNINTEMYEAHLEKYPQGEFARLAEAKLAELQATACPPGAVSFVFPKTNAGALVSCSLVRSVTNLASLPTLI